MGKVPYQIKTTAEDGVLILVETDERGSLIPQRAAVTQIREAAQDFKKAIAPLSAVATSIIEALKSAKMDELTVEFGIELGGSAGIPLITKHEGKANFKVTVTWKPTGKGDGSENKKS